jgi:hypothetical protein
MHNRYNPPPPSLYIDVLDECVFPFATMGLKPTLPISEQVLPMLTPLTNRLNGLYVHHCMLSLTLLLAACLPLLPGYRFPLKMVVVQRLHSNLLWCNHLTMCLLTLHLLLCRPVHKIHWLQHLTLLRSLCLTSHNRLGSHALLSLVLLWRISYRNWPSGLLHRPVLPGLALGSKTIFPRSKTSAMILYGMIPRREGFWLVLHLQMTEPISHIAAFSHHSGNKPRTKNLLGCCRMAHGPCSFTAWWQPCWLQVDF